MSKGIMKMEKKDFSDNAALFCFNMPTNTPVSKKIYLYTS